MGPNGRGRCRPACGIRSPANPFTSWGDTNDYFLAPSERSSPAPAGGPSAPGLHRERERAVEGRRQQAEPPDHVRPFEHGGGVADRRRLRGSVPGEVSADRGVPSFVATALPGPFVAGRPRLSTNDGTVGRTGRGCLDHRAPDLM